MASSLPRQLVHGAAWVHTHGMCPALLLVYSGINEPAFTPLENWGHALANLGQFLHSKDQRVWLAPPCAAGCGATRAAQTPSQWPVGPPQSRRRRTAQVWVLV
eukprot:353447-Chlamydomonas_euryale.AAC.11